MLVAATGFTDGLDRAWSNTAAFIPKLIGFLVILIIGYFVAKMIARIVCAVLERAGFDRAIERGGIKQALAKSNYYASTIVSKVVFYTVFLLAFGVFGTNPVSDLLTSVVAYLPKVFAAILIIVVASAIAAAVKEIVEASLGGLSYGKGLSLAASATIVAIGLFAALNQLQIATPIVNGLFYAVLAVIVGSAVIAIGGGGITPMRTQWEKALQRLEQEGPQMRQQAQGAGQRVEQRFEQRKEQMADVRDEAQSPAGPSYASSRPGNGADGHGNR